MRNPLLRDVGLALAAKLAALTVIYLLFFSGAHQPRLDAPQVAHWILGADTSQVKR